MRLRHHRSLAVVLPAVVLASLFRPSDAAPSLDSCLTDPSVADCVSLDYPSATAQASLSTICGSKPNLAACTFSKVCQNQQQASSLGGWCDPFTLMASACSDMSQISPGVTVPSCSDYNKLCTASSTVSKCKGVSTMSTQGFVNTTYAQYLINSMCDDMDMAGCTACASTSASTFNPTCEPVTVFSDMCKIMPSMRQCAVLRTMCTTTANSCFCKSGSCTAITGSSTGSSSSSSTTTTSNSTSANSISSSSFSTADWESAPPMAMYFHSGIAEYFLFRSWVPRTGFQYAGSLVAVLLLSFVFEGVVVWREVLEQSWHLDEDDRIRLGKPYWTRGFLVDVQRFGITILAVGLGYCVMLLAMTFNAGVFVCCVAGIGAGSVVFRKFKPVRLVPVDTAGLKECC